MRSLLSWLKSEKRILVGVLVPYILLTILYLLLGYLAQPHHRIGGVDSVYYFVYLESLLIDGDLDFTNDFAIHNPPNAEHQRLTEEGVPVNPFPVGPAVSWSPFYLTAHFLAVFLQKIGYYHFDFEPNGHSILYRLSAYLAYAFYMLAGLLVCAFWLKKRVGENSSVIVCNVLLLTTQLTYYIWPEMPFSHSTGFFAAALLFMLCDFYGVHWSTGLAAGFLAITRWQHVTFLLILVWPALQDWRTVYRANYSGLGSMLKKHLLATLGFFIAFLPQFLAWWAMHGRLLVNPHRSDFFDYWLTPDFFDVLFSYRAGLFVWHPVLLLGIFGLIVSLFSNRSEIRFNVISAPILLLFLIQWYINAASIDWYAGWSFGHRRFIELLPAFGLGLGFLLQYTKETRAYHVLFPIFALVFVFLTIWNQLCIVQYRSRRINPGGDVTREQYIDGKFEVLRCIFKSDCSVFDFNVE